MTSDNGGNRYETTHFRTLGWAGAICFAIAPPTFLYEWWLMFYTTALEENPSIGPMMAIACIASFASIPMMIAGRRKRYSASPSVDRLPTFRRRIAEPNTSLQPGQAPI